MEGHIRGVRRFLHNHENNTSQAALFVDLAGLSDATIKFSTPRSHPSALMYTKVVRVLRLGGRWAQRGKRTTSPLRPLGTTTQTLCWTSALEVRSCTSTSPSTTWSTRMARGGATRRERPSRARRRTCGGNFAPRW